MSQRLKDNLGDRLRVGPRAITMIGRPIPIAKSMMTSRFLSAWEGTVVIGDASM